MEVPAKAKVLSQDPDSVSRVRMGEMSSKSSGLVSYSMEPCRPGK